MAAAADVSDDPCGVRDHPDRDCACGCCRLAACLVWRHLYTDDQCQSSLLQGTWAQHGLHCTWMECHHGSLADEQALPYAYALDDVPLAQQSKLHLPEQQRLPDVMLDASLLLDAPLQAMLKNSSIICSLPSPHS